MHYRNFGDSHGDARGSIPFACFPRSCLGGLSLDFARGSGGLVGQARARQRAIADHSFGAWLWFQLGSGGLKPERLLPDALASVGVKPNDLAWVIPTHAHVDRVGGLMDLKNVPVLMAREEIDYMASWGEQRSIQMIPAHAKEVVPRAKPIAFAPTPYETFDESADLFGDGSVVIVKLAGHTPGSVGIFVTLSPTLRIFHVGDAVHDLDGLEERLEKPLVTRVTDVDKAAADKVVSRLSQLKSLDPTIRFVPAHDRSAWEAIFASEDASVCLNARGERVSAR